MLPTGLSVGGPVQTEISNVCLVCMYLCMYVCIRTVGAFRVSLSKEFQFLGIGVWYTHRHFK